MEGTKRSCLNLIHVDVEKDDAFGDGVGRQALPQLLQVHQVLLHQLPDKKKQKIKTTSVEKCY
jgi:hypothetical protein